MFADQYPQFIDVSDVPDEQDPADDRQRQRNRLNERHEALIGSNRDILAGARVLDLACHDGRYAFAALKAGAVHATGVEARQGLLDRAEGALSHYGQDPSTYRFVCGDLFEVLAREEFDADVVFSFGFLYHTYRHTEFLYRLHRLRPTYLVMDTMVTLDTRPTLKLIRERDAEDNRSAAADPWSVGGVLVLRPSLPALELMLQSYGFEVESMHDWPGQLTGRTDQPGIRGYARGKRVTLRCRFGGRAVASGRRTATPLRLPARAPSTKVRASAHPPPAHPRGWRDRINKTLASVSGFEVRRAAKD